MRSSGNTRPPPSRASPSPTRSAATAASATRSRACCGRRRKTAASAASTSSTPAASTRYPGCPACCAEARRHEAGIQTFLLSTSGHRRRMSTYNAPLQDIRFALHDVLGADALFARLGFTVATRDIVDAVLEESALLTQTLLEPLTSLVDKRGCGYGNAPTADTQPPGYQAAHHPSIPRRRRGLAYAAADG